MPEILEELKLILPRDHPFLEKVVNESTGGIKEKLLRELVTVLDDWARNIRDWSDVDDVLEAVRSELKM